MGYVVPSSVGRLPMSKKIRWPIRGRRLSWICDAGTMSYRSLRLNGSVLNTKTLPSKHDTLKQCSLKDGPQAATLAQH